MTGKTDREADDAEAAGLVFASDDEAGIRRRGHARPRYIDESTGRPVTCRVTLERVARLAVPPAWEDVWISADPRSHLQATGRDARGRKQYRYHPEYRQWRETTKFDRLVEFGGVLGRIRARVRGDLARPGHSHEQVVALAVAVLDAASIRVGNTAYTVQNGSYGLTTLRNRHLAVAGNSITFRFRGKSHIRHECTVTDRQLARLLARCRDLPGERLFQWVDDGGDRHPLTADEVNGYLRAASGTETTSKTFRTWSATAIAATQLAGEPDSAPEERPRAVRRAIEAAAAELGNTPAVCRKSYVHPAVVDSFLRGAFSDEWHDASARGSSRLSADERRLVHFLEAHGAES